eukprot:5142866-Alexandrium_andersonii.AAC.1
MFRQRGAMRPCTCETLTCRPTPGVGGISQPTTPTGYSPTPWVRTMSTQPRCVCAASGALPPFPPLRTP